MDISSIANKLACTGVGGANTGKLGCLSLFGTPTHLIALGRGVQIPGSTVFNLAYMTPEVQKGKMIPIIDASAFEDVSAEDSYATNTSGVKRLNLKGLPEYKLTFEEGHEFYRELAKLESFKSYSFVIGDDMGNWMVVKKANGNFAGFSAGHVTPELTKRKVKGGDSESKSLIIQFLDRMEWDTDYAILHREELTFSPGDVPTVNGVQFNYTALPAASDTTLIFDAVLAADNNTKVEGLVADDFRVMVNGAPVAATLAEAAGTYTLTITALPAGATVSIELYDADLLAHVVNSNDVLYRAKPNEVTAISA